MMFTPTYQLRILPVHNSLYFTCQFLVFFFFFFFLKWSRWFFYVFLLLHLANYLQLNQIKMVWSWICGLRFCPFIRLPILLYFAGCVSSTWLTDVLSRVRLVRDTKAREVSAHRRHDLFRGKAHGGDVVGAPLEPLRGRHEHLPQRSAAAWGRQEVKTGKKKKENRSCST